MSVAEPRILLARTMPSLRRAHRVARKLQADLVAKSAGWGKECWASDDFLDCETLKCAIRFAYIDLIEAQPLRCGGRDYIERSLDTWRRYDLLNDTYLPGDPVYTGIKQGFAMSTTNPAFNVTAGASGCNRFLEIFMAGEAGATAVQRTNIIRSTGGTTPTNQTPEKLFTRSAAAVLTFTTSYAGSQPSSSGVAFWSPTFNAFGGGDKIVPPPGAEGWILNAEQAMCISASGTTTNTLHAVIDEL